MEPLSTPATNLTGEFSLAGFRPRTGSLDGWNAAYVRVEDYLRAHRVHNRLHQSRLILQILERATRRHEQNPHLDPTRLAAAETAALMDSWFGEVLGQSDLPHDRIAVEGRVALLLSDGPRKWPYAFLDPKQVPADFVDAMRAGSVSAGPDMAVTSMVPRPIDLGTISGVAGETMETIEKWPILRPLLLWLVFGGALAAIFSATR